MNNCNTISGKILHFNKAKYCFEVNQFSKRDLATYSKLWIHPDYRNMIHKKSKKALLVGPTNKVFLGSWNCGTDCEFTDDDGSYDYYDIYDEYSYGSD